MHAVRPIKLPATSGALGSIGVPGPVFGGWTVRETAGAAAVVRFWDNASAASGTLLGTVALLANASSTVALTHPAQVTAGVFVEYVSGTVEGSVYVG